MLSMLMKILSRWLFRGDPTRCWKRNPACDIEFDFNSKKLCGVGIGETFERLSSLGPVEAPERLSLDQYSYYSRGVEIEVIDGIIRGFTLLWSSEPNVDPFSGTCMYRGRTFELTPGTDEAALVEHFGPPCDRDEDEDGKVLYYSLTREWGDRSDSELDIYFRRSGTMCFLTVC